MAALALRLGAGVRWGSAAARGVSPLAGDRGPSIWGQGFEDPPPTGPSSLPDALTPAGDRFLRCGL